MAFFTFNAQPERTQTPPFSSYVWLEPALDHTHEHVPYWTPEVWLLTGFNFLNRRPHSHSIEGINGISTFNAQPERTQTPPFLSFFWLEPALDYTHEHVPYWILDVWLLTGFICLDRRRPTRSIAGTYGLLNFQLSTRTDPNSTIFVIFFGKNLHCPPPHTHVPYWTPEVWFLTGFNF